MTRDQIIEAMRKGAWLEQDSEYSAFVLCHQDSYVWHAVSRKTFNSIKLTRLMSETESGNKAPFWVLG